MDNPTFSKKYVVSDLVYYNGDPKTLMQVKGRQSVNGESRIKIRPYRAKGRQTTLIVRDCDCIPA